MKYYMKIFIIFIIYYSNAQIFYYYPPSDASQECLLNFNNTKSCNDDYLSSNIICLVSSTMSTTTSCENKEDELANCCSDNIMCKVKAKLDDITIERYFCLATECNNGDDVDKIEDYTCSASSSLSCEINMSCNYLSAGAIAGIVIGSVLILVIVVGYYCYHKKKKARLAMNNYSQPGTVQQQPQSHVKPQAQLQPVQVQAMTAPPIESMGQSYPYTQEYYPPQGMVPMQPIVAAQPQMYQPQYIAYQPQQYPQQSGI